MKIWHNWKQYAKLRRSPAVARFIDERASAILREAQASGRGTYVMDSGAPDNADRWRAFVATGDTEARRDQAINDTLQRSLWAGKL